MRAIIVLVVLGLTATSVMSACAAANAWQDAIVATSGSTLTAGLLSTSGAGAATDADGVSKCAYTLGTTLVCTTDQPKLYASIQKYIDNTRTTLETAAGVRDKYIIEKRGDVVKVFSSLRRLNELATSNKNTLPATYATLAGSFAGYAKDLTANFTAVVAGFQTYQDNRATCLNALLKAQAAVLCNAFTDGATAGMVKTDGSESFTADDTLLASLSTTCLPYIQNSATQSQIILTSVYSAGIATLVSAVEKIAGGDTAGGTTDFVSAWSTFAKASFSSTNAEKPVAVPTACTTAALCQPYIDNNWFIIGTTANNGFIVNDAIIRGGDVPTAFTFTRVLESEGGERRLAGTGMTVDMTKYAFTYGFKSNPGNVDNTQNSKSALRNGIVAVAVAALALVF